jgi:rod shape-determining protein MreB and related proteins
MARTQSFTGRDLGIDLGTANTLVHVHGRGVVLDEPSVVAVDASNGRVLSVGSEAKEAIGRTPSTIVAVRPIRGGVIADYESAERMLRHFVRKVVRSGRLSRPRVVVCVPSGITGVEQQAVIEAAACAGARQVRLVEQPMAAAIGAGLPVGEPTGSMVVDVGGGTTEVAIVSLGGIVAASSVRTAGDAMDAAITAYLKKRYGLAVGERTAEDIKMSIGSASPTGSWSAPRRETPPARQAADGPPESSAVTDVAVRPRDGDRADALGLLPPERCTVRGRDHVSGLPKTLQLAAEEVRDALADPVADIVAVVRSTLDQTPPELAGDVMDRGIVLTGGGALLRGLDVRLGRELDIPVVLADDPMHCVAVGTGRCVEEFESLSTVLNGQPRRVPVRMA